MYRQERVFWRLKGIIVGNFESESKDAFFIGGINGSYNYGMTNVDSIMVGHYDDTIQRIMLIIKQFRVNSIQTGFRRVVVSRWERRDMPYRYAGWLAIVILDRLFLVLIFGFDSHSFSRGGLQEPDPKIASSFS